MLKTPSTNQESQEKDIFFLQSPLKQSFSVVVAGAPFVVIQVYEWEYSFPEFQQKSFEICLFSCSLPT
jgi:hypothetical protein